MKGRLKKTLSIIIAAAMLVSITPATISAVESEPSVETSMVQDYTDDTESEDTTVVDEQTDAVSVQSLTESKPADGMTTTQPFSAGTGGSSNFRIPALVTLDDGTLVAAADARWNTSADAGGLDTIVSRSTDQGANWAYTFANYLGDNGNSYNSGSTAFIDPALATDGSTVYMLVDLFPAGYALNSANNTVVAASAFDEQGRLKLAASGSSEYSYYLGTYSGGYAQIYDAEGAAVEGYTVDAYFYLYQNGEKVSNLFYSDAAYQVVKTTYLYLTKSTDGGATWSAPALLNVKNADEQFYGVGPGQGIVTSDGTILFSCYEWGGSSDSQRSSFIYSTDGGATWNRTANITESMWSSENQLVELNDGTIRMFFRNGNSQICYVDATGNASSGYTWGSVVQTGISNNSNCQISAMKYSKEVDGKEAILLSCPTSSSWGSRIEGKIFVALVNEDGTLDFSTYSSTAVTDGTFQYSCLTELSDGSVGLLYENGSASVTYTNFDIKNLALGAQIGDPEPGFLSEDGTILTSLSFAATDGAKTIAFRGLSDGQYLSVSSSAEGVATVIADGSSMTVTPVGEGTATITATVQSNARSAATGSTYELKVNVSGVDAAYKGTISENQGTTRYVLDTDGITAGEYLIVASGYALQNTDGKTSTGRQSVTVSGNEVTGVTSDTYILWTFSGEGNSFTIKNTNAYLYLLGSDTLGSSVQNCTIANGSNGTYAIHGNNRYLEYFTGFLGYGACFRTTSSESYVSLYRKETSDTTWSTDVSKLQEQMTAATALTQEEYTADSWSAMATALEAAKTYSSASYSTESEAQTSQTAIDRAAQTLAEAIDSLEKAPSTVDITVVVGQSTTVSVEGSLTTSPNTGVATAEITDGIMIITGVAAGTTTIVVGTVTYNVTVEEIPGYVDMTNTPFCVGSSYTGAGEELTKLTLSEGLTYDVDVNLTGGTWSITDTSIATVDSSGRVTGVNEGETTLTYTAADGTVYTMPVVIRAGATTYTNKICSLHISEITDTDVWYSWNCSGNANQFVKAVDGEAIYVSYNSNVAHCINFYAKPYEGYALTAMGATNSLGSYAALNTTTAENNIFYTGGSSWAGYNERNSFGDTAVLKDIQAAIDMDCDGAMGFSRGTGDSNIVNCDLTFRSQKLPTVTKEIVSVGGEAYTEGMTAKEGDVIVYNVTVTQYATTEAITYTNETLVDNLSGATFSNNSNTTTPTLFDTTLTSDVSKIYQVTYTIQNSDLDKEIVNTVDLSYSYQSTYSTGAFGGSAQADASFTALTFTPQHIVVDFGLPVKIDYSGEDAHGRYNLVSGEALYGTVTVKDNVVTYTPNQILQGVDTVTLTNTEGGHFSFYVYPATTVYYEEGFADLSAGFTGGEKGSGTQTTEFVSSQTNQYGYDDKYSEEAAGPSNGTQAVSMSTGSYATFSFTGTGVDIYANCTTATGAVMIRLYQDDTLKQIISVDTVMKNGTSDFTDNQEVSGYNIPIASITGLEHGTYDVRITHTKAGSDQANRIDGVKLDGYRVHGTLANDSTVDDNVYALINEANPTFVELRDSVLQVGLSAKANNSKQYADQIAENVMGQVYALNANGVNALVLSPSLTTDDNTVANNTVVTDLIDYGPKNEIYLQKNDTLVFSVTAENVQIGLKALNMATTYTINDGSSTSLTTSTDMFYNVTPESDGTVTIKNTGDGILSVTELKLFNTQNGAQASGISPMSARTLTRALMYMGYEETPSYADAAVNVNLVDYTGTVIASTALTVRGEEGSEAVFAAEDILSAAEQILPDGYDFVDKDSISGQTVLYGESMDADIQIGRVATLNVTYKNLFGKTKGTATLTAVQTTSAASHKFTASELRNAAPGGYWTGTLINTSVKYGSTASRTVIGLGL